MIPRQEFYAFPCSNCHTECMYVLVNLHVKMSNTPNFATFYLFRLLSKHKIVIFILKYIVD